MIRSRDDDTDGLLEAPPAWLRLLLPGLFVLALLGLWQVAVQALHVSPLILPPPSAILRDLVDNAGSLGMSLVNTLVVTIEAFLLGSAVGIGLAIALSRSRLFALAVGPLMVVFQVTPVVAIAPLVLVWVGLDHVNRALLALASIIAFFPVLSNTLLGLASVDHALQDLFTMRRASSWQRLLLLELPSALPQMLGGLRIAGGLALVGAVVAEFVAGSGTATGLAWRIIEASNRLNTPRMFACLFLLAMLGVMISGALALVQHLCLRHWHESALRRER